MEVLKAIQKAKDVKSKLSNTEKKVSILGWGEPAKDGTFLGETEPWNPLGSLIINTPHETSAWVFKYNDDTYYWIV